MEVISCACACVNLASDVYDHDVNLLTCTGMSLLHCDKSH